MFIEPELQTKEFTELCETFLKLRTVNECKKFLRDLCTIAEIREMAERFQAAKELNKGLPYRAVAKKTGSSTSTVSRVAYFLHHGTNGYKLVLHRQ